MMPSRNATSAGWCGFGRTVMRLRKVAAGTVIVLAAAAPGLAVSLGQDKVTHESAHFLVTAERRKTHAAAAAEAAAWLEDALKKQSAFYAFTPDEKIQVVLRDEDDYSNGYAFATNSWIVLHLPPVRFTLRGPGQWMPNVAAHELAHILTLRKMGVKERFLGVEAFASFGTRRGRYDADGAWLPDDVPAWLAEGLAQYGALHVGYDTLDSRRAMLLREAWKAGSLPTLKAVETFSGDARDGEMVYNVGFHLTDFLYRTYGRDAVNAMMDAWNDHGYHEAFVRAFGATPAAVDARWRAELDTRFAAEGLTRPQENPATKRPNETVYRLETSPVRDEKRGITYYLSSRANDYGITHLYAADDRGGRARLIRRDVNAPLNLAPDGSLLFTMNRPDRRTGASRADLYRYTPRDRRVTRITENRRVIAGAEAGKRMYALTQNAGKVRLVRLTKRGKPDAWVDAPAGTEFSSLAPGDDSTLYVTAARGAHADILRFDTRTGKISTAEGSPAREIDPHFHAGRLYFASDVTGEQAIYSRAGDTLYRHTPPGISAFSPFVSAGTLHFSAYDEGGFRRRTQPLATYAVKIEPADSSGGTYASPPPPRLRNLKRDATWLEPLGYYATLGYAYTPSADVRGSLYGDAERLYRLNPCSHQAFAGGGVLAADADQRHQLAGTFLAGRCLENMNGARNYLPFAGIEYFNDNQTADLVLLAEYQHQQLANRSNLDRLGGLHSFQVMGAGLYSLGLNVHDVLFAQIGGAVAHLPGPQGAVEGGGGLLLGNTLGLAVLEPGADFVNQGIYASLTGALGPGFGLYGVDGGVHAHVERTLFLGLHGDFLQTTIDPEDFDAGFAATADARMPLGATLGTTGARGLYMESLFLTAGYALRANASTGVMLAHAPGIRAAQARAAGRTAAPVAQIREVGPQTIRTGIRLKVVTPGARVAFWNIMWESPAGAPEDGYLSVSLSL